MLERFFRKKSVEKAPKPELHFVVFADSRCRLLQPGEGIDVCTECGLEGLSIYANLDFQGRKMRIRLQWKKGVNLFDWGMFDIYNKEREANNLPPLQQFGHTLTTAIITHDKDKDIYRINNSPMHFSHDFKELYINNKLLIEWQG